MPHPPSSQSPEQGRIQGQENGGPEGTNFPSSSNPKPGEHETWTEA